MDFFACQSFQVNLFYAEKRPPQNIRFCAQPYAPCKNFSRLLRKLLLSASRGLVLRTAERLRAV